MKGYQYWRTNEIERLRDEYPDVSTATLAKNMGRSTHSVTKMAGRMGLKKSKHYQRQVNRGRQNLQHGWIKPGQRLSPETEFKSRGSC